MEVPAPEVILCDTSYVSHFNRAARRPDEYEHWPSSTVDRIAAAVLAITPFTLAEVRFGWRKAKWGPAKIADAENRLKSFVLIPLDEAVLDAYVDLWTQSQSEGKTLSNNDVWIAGTAVSQGIPLITCDELQASLPGLDAIYLPAP